MHDRHCPGLVVDVKAGERLSFSGRATVELVYKSGSTARLRVVAPRDVTIKKEHGEHTNDVPSMTAYKPS